MLPPYDNPNWLFAFFSVLHLITNTHILTVETYMIIYITHNHDNMGVNILPC